MMRRQPVRRQGGNAAVELAFLLPVLLLLLAGIVEVGRALWYVDALTKGTRDAARYLSTVPAADLAGETTGASTTRSIVAQAAAKAKVPGFAVGQVLVSCSPSCAAAPTEVTVAVDNYQMTLGQWVPFIGGVGVSAFGSRTVTVAPYTTMPYMQ